MKTVSKSFNPYPNNNNGSPYRRGSMRIKNGSLEYKKPPVV